MFRIFFISTVILASLGAGMTIPALTGFSSLVSRAHAAAPALADAIRLHDAARDGDGAAADAVNAFIALTAAEPKNAVALAYLGSSYTISARDASGVTDKVRFTNRGLRHLDEAVALAPEDVVVRLIRVNVQMKLPAMFARAKPLADDLQILDKLYSAAPSPALARAMIGVYTALAETQPDQAHWPEKLAAAQSLAAGK